MRERGGVTPKKALLVEAQLSGLSNELSRLCVVPFRKIPYFPEPILPGRSGAVLCGDLGGIPVLVLEGMVHLFEGYLPGEVAFPLRVLAALGIGRVVFIATGRAVPLGSAPGDLLLVADHINLTGRTPLKGIIDAERPTFVEKGEVPAAVRAAATAAAQGVGLALDEGVAALIHGPAWPTPAEASMLRGFGADACTMALGPELEMAAYLGIESAAFLALRTESRPWGKRHLEFCKKLLTIW